MKSVPFVFLVLVAMTVVAGVIHERISRKRMLVEVESLRAQAAEAESLRQEVQRLNESRIDAVGCTLLPARAWRNGGIRSPEQNDSSLHQKM